MMTIMLITIKHTTTCAVLLMLLLSSVVVADNSSNNNNNLRTRSRGLVGECPAAVPWGSTTCDGCEDQFECNYGYTYFATLQAAGPRNICKEPLTCQPTLFATWDGPSSSWQCATYGLVDPNCRENPAPPALMHTSCTP